MQSVSSLFQSIVDSGEYFVETNLIICPNTILPDADYVDNTHKQLVQTYAYNEEQLWNIKTNRNTFSNNSPQVGCATCGEIDVEMKYPSVPIPTMARITPYVRVISNDEQSVSEWIRKGVFFIDSREVTKNDDDLRMLTLHGYDSMMKANNNYPWSSEASPKDYEAVLAIADAIGVKVDSRTIKIDNGQIIFSESAINKKYTVVAPIGYAMIETLGHIAGAYGGNFIINDLGMLQLIQLCDLPAETNYLTDEMYNPITFGGDRIDLGDE